MGGRSKSSRKEEKNTTQIVKITVAAVVAAIFYFVILAVFSVAALNSGMSASSYMPVGMAAGALTGFAGGFAAVRPIKEKGALYGLITGVIQAMLCSAALFIVNDASAGNGIFILSGLIIIFAIAGGISAVNLKIKKKY